MNEAEKSSHAEARMEVLVELVGDALRGDPEGLADEMDALAAIARTWGHDYNDDDDDPRVAMLCFLLADLANVVTASIIMQKPRKKPTRRSTRPA